MEFKMVDIYDIQNQTTLPNFILALSPTDKKIWVVG
jgi:hypothetical protein